MKAIALADLHIDKNRRFDDTKAILRQITTYSIKNGVEQVWILGDIYQGKRPHSIEKILFYKFVKSMTVKGITVLILPGNHDSGADMVSAVDEFGILELPNVKLLNNPTVLEVENGRIYLGHFLINGAKLGPSDYITSNAIGLQNVLETPADLYIIGDVHKAQQLNTNPDVFYVGSPETLNFGERNDEKGFMIVETSKEDIPRCHFVPVKNRHMIQYDLTGGLNSLGITELNRGSIVKVKITCNKEEYKLINEELLRKQFSEAQELKIEYVIVREDRVRNADISEGSTADMAFANYAKEVQMDSETTELGLQIIKEAE